MKEILFSCTAAIQPHRVFTNPASADAVFYVNRPDPFFMSGR
ncbi:hypothetical protein [Komagataeibacter europaeus]|nr:hypothetical protein [Komagataeibacter europaeus]